MMLNMVTTALLGALTLPALATSGFTPVEGTAHPPKA